MICNVLEMENEYPSGNDSAFYLSFCEITEPGQFSAAYVSRSQSGAESLGFLSSLEVWRLELTV